MRDIVIYILGLAVAFGAYCIDSSIREKNNTISDMKSEIRKLEDRLKRSEESREYFEEKAEKYENAYYELLDDCKKSNKEE